MVTGSHNEPSNQKECEKTWIPLLRNMGFRVIVALGDTECDDEILTFDDFNNYYKFIDKDTIQFRTFDSKMGLFDKSIKLPAKWILNETDYEYYFRIDSDSFVHPERFKKMLEDNFRDYPNVNYMGCCHPHLGWSPNKLIRQLVCKVGCMASGTGYMVSRRAMKLALDKMRVLQPFEFQTDDWVLGRAMWENQIPMLHDSRIYFESKHKTIIDSKNGLPDISDSDSHLAIQHYMNGHMKKTIKKLKL